MLRIEKLKKVKGNFPVLVGSNIIPKNICKILIEEISNSKSFDDMIMGGRSRINKGSKNFDEYLPPSCSFAQNLQPFLRWASGFVYQGG